MASEHILGRSGIATALKWLFGLDRKYGIHGILLQAILTGDCLSLRALLVTSRRLKQYPGNS